jgi:hypothetical protein
MLPDVPASPMPAVTRLTTKIVRIVILLSVTGCVVFVAPIILRLFAYNLESSSALVAGRIAVNI